MSVKPPIDRALIGARGEEAATDYLRQRGYRLCGRNWRSGRYELDIILTHWDTLHFVEVKTRRAGSLTTPMEAMTEQKCNALRRAARAFVAQQGRTYEGYRLQFDLAAVTMYDDGRTEVEMYENVVEFGW